MLSVKQLSNWMCDCVRGQVNQIVKKMGDGGGDGGTADSRAPTSNRFLFSFLSSFESYFVSLQSLLIWEKPYLSAVAFITLNCLYWLLVSWSRRVYSIVALLFLMVTIYKLWTCHIWPEIRVPPADTEDTEGWIPVHPKVLSAPEINYYINEFVNMLHASFIWLIQLRKSHHGFFCLIVSSVLVMAAIIGRLVPGVIIVYTLMTTFSLGPGIILYVIPENWLMNLRSLLSQRVKQQDESNKKAAKENINQVNDSLLPDICEETAKELFLEENESQFNLSFVETNFGDESSLQLLSASQLDVTLDDELGINIQPNNHDNDDRNKSPPRSSRSSSSSSHGMHFVSSHFSRNSSLNDLDAEYELISDSELQDSTGSTRNTPQSF